MSLQGDSKVHITKAGDHIIVTCDCGEGYEHGQLEFRRDTSEDFPGFFIELWFRPYGGWIDRIKQAWRVLIGHSIFCDNFWNKPTAHDVAAWLEDPEGKGYISR